MDLLCGPWGGALCSPQRLLDYLGSISNGYAPFQINYFLHKSQNYQSLIPHNPEVIPCNQEPLPGKKLPILISFEWLYGMYLLKIELPLGNIRRNH